MSGRHTGRTDIPLTGQGRLQAQLAGTALRGRLFARVRVSPLLRARETAALAGLPVTDVDADLAEWDYGRYDGLTSAEIRAIDPGWSLWTAGAPGGESPAQVGARCDRALAACAGVEGDIALVAHGHLLRVLAARWLGHEPAAGAMLALDTASISELGREHDLPVVRRWNDTRHLATG